MINYVYVETNSKDMKPQGEWEFWGMRITPTEKKAVWRRTE